jgi:glycosyltransferase involved in cell wall biosynthesis
VFGVAAALSAGGVRKNAQLAINLFRRAFPARPDVRLRVKITPGSPGLETHDDSRVEVLRALLPEAELADWYRSLTAFVSVSAGEGFGLHLLEAMACGVPLVAPCHGGPADFFDDSVGWPVAYRPVRVDTDIYRGGMIEPDADAVVAGLRAVADAPAEAARRGAAAAERATGFTWAATAAGVAAAMREHELLN